MCIRCPLVFSFPRVMRGTDLNSHEMSSEENEIEMSKELKSKNYGKCVDEYGLSVWSSRKMLRWNSKCKRFIGE